jgi:hypothetical protein
MSKTVKIILIIVVIGILGIVCLCLALGGLAALGSFLATSTPTPLPPTFTPIPPTAVPPTAVPAVIPTSGQAGPAPVNLAPADQSFVLDGVEMNVNSVRYSLINGGESAANFISPNDGFLVVVTLASNTKALDFFYDNYIDTMKLVDLDTGQGVEADWVNWSSEDSVTNSGYIKISFPVQSVPARPALYFTDEKGVDLSSLLPGSAEVENPWWDVKQKFEVTGMDVRVQSAVMASSYTAPDGKKYQKKDPNNKVLTIRFVSSFKDLSGLSEWYPLMLKADDLENPYDSVYASWTNESNTGQGFIEISYEVPADMDTFILYLPYDNLMDLSGIIKKK